MPPSPKAPGAHREAGAVLSSGPLIRASSNTKLAPFTSSDLIGFREETGAWGAGQLGALLWYPLTHILVELVQLLSANGQQGEDTTGCTLALSQ